MGSTCVCVVVFRLLCRSFVKLVKMIFLARCDEKKNRVKSIKYLWWFKIHYLSLFEDQPIDKNVRKSKHWTNQLRYEISKFDAFAIGWIALVLKQSHNKVGCAAVSAKRPKKTELVYTVDKRKSFSRYFLCCFFIFCVVVVVAVFTFVRWKTEHTNRSAMW